MESKIGFRPSIFDTISLVLLALLRSLLSRISTPLFSKIEAMDSA
ncbi:hypothetical protein LEP1GSC103_0655 [Leptospira borgpetersenii serovar Javanica str. UI 09931]|uniref:Uncharacterized protein n=3 Tax=Leptospira borgpetersenii TaxID=174 RepID=M6W056_LEPBO|nr:hypothetical protein LEP1GSC128_1323 [Leptospira borgpetersenii str. 200801926]EMN12892.1 hypothetical protein LEP1GSC055_2874 [Leptospira borgpetersenii str. Brem 307]EMO63127.1 hypothetical protein LEP1GSC133_3429 [Leptospira borgpetersenii serovar Pomona str. 200901868]ENO62806.1 hypothetical protein LEP1GSC191_3887 [Leptospira borgpetersenii serovar Mini str. 201000851]EPG55899.1 hypothetical protein LEP1GSC103_0655 [Leptospira borgpetersenii serovar Javanica str. UI 09931]